MRLTVFLGLLPLFASLLATNAATASKVPLNDARFITASTQDSSGQVWAISTIPETLLRWEDDGWRDVSDASAWEGSHMRNIQDGRRVGAPFAPLSPASAGVLALWPSPLGGVESLWESVDPVPRATPPSTETKAGGTSLRVSRIYHYRHTLEHDRIQSSNTSRSWQHPADPHSSNYLNKEKWRSAPIRAIMPRDDSVWLLSTPEEEVRSFGLLSFARGTADAPLLKFPATDLESAKTRPRSLYQPRAVSDATGAIWIWANSNRSRTDQGNPSRFFARFADGLYDFEPSIKDLPEEEITEFVLLPGGEKAVVAVQNHGLWTVDLRTLQATPRSTPPIPLRSTLWSWQGWEDGLEIVLATATVGPGRTNYQAYWAIVWLKSGDTWTAHGRVRVDTWQGYGQRQLPCISPNWTRWHDHLILSGLRKAHVLALNEPQASITELSWPLGIGAHVPDAAYVLPERDELLIVGRTTTRLKRGQLEATLEAGASPVLALSDCLRGANGQLFALKTTGPREYELLHWDGQHLHRQPLPLDQAYRPTLRQDGTGRVWLSQNDGGPAWTYQPDAPEAQRWQKHARLLDLIADYAATPGPKHLQTLRNEPMPSPAWHADGRALAYDQNTYLLWNGKTWTPLPKPDVSGNTTGLRFAPGGEPEITLSSRESLRDHVWQWRTETGWQMSGSIPSRYARRSEAAAQRPPEPPQWITASLPKSKRSEMSPTIIAEDEQHWWVLHRNELWRAHAGQVRPALLPGVAHPWLGFGSSLLETVEHDAAGNRYLWYYDQVIIIPVAALAP